MMQSAELAKKQKTKQTQQEGTLGKCRGEKYHTDYHDHSTEVKYCRKCNSTTAINADNTCYCCKSKFEREITFINVKKILNKTIQQYKFYVEAWQNEPLPRDVKLICEVKHGNFVYQIDIKYVVLYLESLAMDQENRQKALLFIRQNIDTVSFSIRWGSRHASKMSMELMY